MEAVPDAPTGAEMVQSADVDTPPSQEAELEDLDLGLIGIDDLEPYFDIFQDTDSIFEQFKPSCDWEADPGTIDPPFLSTLAEGTLDLTHISSEVAMTTARPEREAPPKKSRAERKRRRSEPPVSRPGSEESPRGKHRRAAGCARRTGYPGEPAVTGGDTASPEPFQNGLQTPPPSSSPTTVQLQLSPSPPASLQLLCLPDSPVYQLIPTATLSPFFRFHPNTAATPTYILVQAPLPSPRGLQDVPRSPAGGTEAPIVPSSPPGSMSDSASRGPPPPSASPLSPTTGSPSSQSKTARCVCPTLTDAVVEYIQQAKAHMKLISQEMEAGLAMSSHYVDVRLVQRQIHIRSGKNANKCLDKELVVMGDAERQQSCVGRSQIFQSSPGAKPRRSVVLLGNAGMGKTTLIKKLCLDWSEGSLPQFDFVFLLDGRALSVTAATHSLQSLLFGLSSAPPLPPADPDAVFARVREAPERVLLVLDGFEAPRDYETLLQASPEAAGEEPGRGHTPRQLYSALLQRRLLPGCSLLLAARPGSTASQVLRRADGLLELRGFSPAELSLYLGRRFPGAARRALAALEGAGFLRALCRNPGLCAMACRVLLPPEGSGRSPLPDTLTDLCHRVVRRGMEEALAGRRRGNGGRRRDGGASTAGGTRGGRRRACTADGVRRTRSCTRTEEEEEEEEQEEEEGEKERREERELLAQLSQLAWEGVKQHSSLLATDQTISARLKGLALRTGLFHSYRLRGGRCGGGAGGGSGETEGDGNGETGGTQRHQTEGSPGGCDDVTDDHILSWANPFLQSFLAGAHLSFSRSVSDRHFLVHTLPNQSGSRRRRRPQGEGLELTHRFTVSLLFLDEAELRDLVADADAVATETAAAKRASVSAHLEALGRGVLGPAQLLEACHYAHEVGGGDRNVGARLAGRLARNLPEVLSFHGVPLCPPDVFVLGKVLEAALTQDRGTSLPDSARPRVFHLGLEDTGVPLSGLRALVGLSNVTVFRACIADVIALWEELEQHGEAGLLKEAVSKFTVNPLKVTQPSQLEQLATLVGIHTRRRLTDSPVDSVLVEGVPAVSTLRHLELELGPEKAALALPKLLEALPALHNLQLLDLEGSKLGDRGAVGLAKALPSLSSLEILNLSQNSIGDRGLERLAPALGTLPSLHCLSLYSNVIGDAGAESLAAALPSMTSLTDLDVKFNKFTDVGAQCLGASLNRCPWIKSLGMWNQCIPYFVFERLQQQDPRIRSSL